MRTEIVVQLTAFQGKPRPGENPDSERIFQMRHRISRRQWLALAGAAALVALGSACGFLIVGPPLPFCENFDNIGLTEVEGGPPALVFEEPGTVKVMHGLGSAKWTSGYFIKVEQSAELPPYANRATVFLNGWRADYTNGDHHLLGVGSMIARIAVQPGKITWNAAGALGDRHNGTPFTWSYAYTIIAWNDANLRAVVDHSDEEVYCKTKGVDASDNFFVAGNEQSTTALATFVSFLENPGFASGRSVAVLPRGYGFVWDDGDDHHLLQLAYNLESAAPFVSHQTYRKAFDRLDPMPAGTARAGAGYVSWKTSAILKDNSGRRAFKMAEIVSGLGGADVEVIQPPFSILPMEDVSGGLGGAGLKSADVVIDNLPYACAVPVLTGWDIGYARDDQHVKNIGIWLDRVRYDRPPGAMTGTLRYRVNSILKDNDDFPDNYYAHKVTVLGLQPLAGTKTK